MTTDLQYHQQKGSEREALGLFKFISAALLKFTRWWRISLYSGNENIKLELVALLSI